MRLAILDIGSNSANLRVVDAYPGSPPLPVYRHKTPTRLAESIRRDGVIDPSGVTRLVEAVRAAVARACRQQVAELIPFATSAVRDAANRDEILHALATEAALGVGFLSGEDEARPGLPDLETPVAPFWPQTSTILKERSKEAQINKLLTWAS